MLADPGVGKQAAPIGSVEWAQYVRLQMQSAVKELEKAPERMQGYVDLVLQHRAWTLMNKPDGSFFDSWDDFCGHKQPWGLGKSWVEIRPVLEAAHGKKAVQLGTVSPAAAPQPGPGRGHVSEEKHTAMMADGFSEPTKRHEERLRAIAERAPHQVKDLFRQDLIGVVEAAKLGPKNPTPDEAAKVTQVAIAATDVVKSEPKPETPKQKRELQRKVNATVRELIGDQKDPVRAALRTIERLAEDQRLALFKGLVSAYPNRLALVQEAV